MNKLSETSIVIYSSLIFAICAIALSPVKAESAVPAEKKAAIVPKAEPQALEHCQAMQAHKQKMLDDMKAQDDELTGLLAKMNSAPDDKKVGLMAAVVTRMVEQRIAMDERKAKMEGMMMRHMEMGNDAMQQQPVSKEGDKK